MCVYFQTPKQGSDTVVHVALSESIESGGHYFDNCKKTKPPSPAADKALCASVFNNVCKLLNIEEFGRWL